MADIDPATANLPQTPEQILAARIAAAEAAATKAEAAMGTLAGLEKTAQSHVKAIDAARKAAEDNSLAEWTLLVAFLSALFSGAAAFGTFGQWNRTTEDSKLAFSIRVFSDFHADISTLNKEANAITAFVVKDPSGKIDINAVPPAAANKLIDIFNDFVTLRRYNGATRLMDANDWKRNATFVCNAIGLYPGAFDYLSAKISPSDQEALKELKSCLTPE